MKRIKITATPTGNAIIYESRDDWLRARYEGIGASEVASVLGLSRFGSPWSVWQRKVDRPEPVDDDAGPMAEWGHRHERAIAEKFAEAVLPEIDDVPHGCRLHDPGDWAVWWADEPPWLFATPDRLVLDRDGEIVGPLELKCAWYEAAREWGERIPLGYRCQLQTQMRCIGTDQGFYAVLLNGYDFRWYRERYHLKFMSAAVRKLKRFWQHVQERTCPPVDFSEATSRAIAAHYAEPTDETIYLPEEAEEWHRDRLHAVARMAELERQKRAAENKLKAAIGAATRAVLPDGAVGYSYKPNKRGVRSLRQVAIQGDENE